MISEINFNIINKPFQKISNSYMITYRTDKKYVSRWSSLSSFLKSSKEVIEVQNNDKILK